MRLLFPVAIGFAAAASAQPAAAPVTQSHATGGLAGSDCPDLMQYFARRGGMWQGDPMRPHKLTELPPAETFAAVYKLDERGCMVPVLYRDVRGR